jgi:hypothetical protein
MTLASADDDKWDIDGPKLFARRRINDLHFESNSLLSVAYSAKVQKTAHSAALVDNALGERVLDHIGCR